MVYLSVSQMGAQGQVLSLPSPIPVWWGALALHPVPSLVGVGSTTLCLRVYECPGLLTKGELQWHSAQLWGPGECHIFGSSWVIGRQLSIKGPFHSVVMALLMWLLTRKWPGAQWGSVRIGLASCEGERRCPLSLLLPWPGHANFLQGGSPLIQLPSSTQCPGKRAIDLFSSLSFLQLGLKFYILSLCGVSRATFFLPLKPNSCKFKTIYAISFSTEAYFKKLQNRALNIYLSLHS